MFHLFPLSYAWLKKIRYFSERFAFGRLHTIQGSIELPEILDVNGCKVRVREVPLCAMSNYRIKEIRVVAIK